MNELHERETGYAKVAPKSSAQVAQFPTAMSQLHPLFDAENAVSLPMLGQVATAAKNLFARNAEQIRKSAFRRGGFHLRKDRAGFWCCE